MALDLPPEVLAGMGLSGQPILPPDDGSAAMPQPDPFGGLHPSVVQGLGWAPAPVGMPQAAPQLDQPAPAPPSFTSLPSAPTQPQPEHPAQSRPDFTSPPPGAMPAKAAPVPQSKPVTPEQGFAIAQARQDAAQNAEVAAVGQQLEAKRPENDADLAAAQQHIADEKANNEESKRISDAKVKAAALNQEKIKATDQEINNYKVDQDKYWKDAGIGTHIGWYIAMALSEIGDALQHKQGPNPVLQMLEDKMHQAVVAQVDARDQLKEKRGRLVQEGTEQQAGFADRQAEILRLQGQGDRMLANKVELDARAAGNSIDQAKAALEVARLRSSGADKYQASIVQQSDYDIKKQTLGLQKSANAIAGGHLALAQQAEKRAQKLQDLEYGPGGFKEQELGIKAADEQRKALKDQQQKVKDEGIGNPTTGDALLTERGRGLMAQADQLEAVARTNPAQAAGAYVAKLRAQATTPQAKAQVDQIEQHIRDNPATAQDVASGYAAQLRQEANTTEVSTISDPTARREVQNGIKWAQDLINTTSKIKAFLTSDPDITDRDGWAKLQAEYGTAQAEYAKSIGANASSRELDAISKHIMTYDPSSLIDRTFRKAPGAAALDGIQDAVKGGVDSLLKSHRIKDGWIPSSPSEHPAATFGDKTAQEIGGGAEPSIVSRGLTRAAYALGPQADPGIAQAAIDRPQLAAENAAAVGTNYGLSPKIESDVSSLITQAGAANNAKRRQIIEQLAAPIVKNDRPSLAAGLLNMIRDQDPAMFEDVLKEVGPERAKDIRAFAPPIIQVPPGGLQPSKLPPEVEAAWRKQTGQ